MSTSSSDKIILALDLESIEEAEKFVTELRDEIGVFKVGKQLFTRYGPKVVEMIHHHQGKVFLDLKFHDIPHTVARAVQAACELKVFMLTLHAAGGYEMMCAAADAAATTSQRVAIPSPLILAVTVLTSLRQEDLKELGIASPVKEVVLRLANLSKSAGIHGVVASAQEAASIRASCGNDLIIVTPGIRPEGSASDDQKRTVIPSEALSAGADYLVIGRPILKAQNPLQAAKEIVGSLRG